MSGAAFRIPHRQLEFEAEIMNPFEDHTYNNSNKRSKECDSIISDKRWLYASAHGRAFLGDYKWIDDYPHFPDQPIAVDRKTKRHARKIYRKNCLIFPFIYLRFVHSEANSLHISLTEDMSQLFDPNCLIQLSGCDCEA